MWPKQYNGADVQLHALDLIGGGVVGLAYLSIAGKTGFIVHVDALAYGNHWDLLGVPCGAQGFQETGLLNQAARMLNLQLTAVYTLLDGITADILAIMHGDCKAPDLAYDTVHAAMKAHSTGSKVTAAE